MPRALSLLLFLIPALAMAAKPRERWGFAWNPHPQAAEVGYFELQIDVPGKRYIIRINGGIATETRGVLLPAAIPGDGIAVLRACRPTGECSGNSNAVFLDRTAPQPPTAVSHGFTRR
jgi:hypothetical protein